MTSLRSCLLAAMMLAALSCASAPQRLETKASYTFAPKTSWLEEPDAFTPETITKDSTPEARFLAAEHAYWKGDLERAFDLHLGLLAQDPDHPLARFTAARLQTMTRDVERFDQRIRPVLESIPLDSVHPLTALSLARIGLHVSLIEWDARDAAEPFDMDPLGIPQFWTISPLLSPTRLSDMDRSFPLEDKSSIPRIMHSPVSSTDSPENQDISTPYVADYGLIMPSPEDGDGIYYLETFATVSGPGDQVYWVAADAEGSTTFWLDGVVLFRADERDHTTHQRLRRVKLSPGTHRILVKMAYENGEADRFDVRLMRKGATALSDSNVTFSRMHSGPLASSQMLSASWRPQELEEVRGEIKSMGQVDLYLSLLAAHEDDDGQRFDAAYTTLIAAYPKFAPARALYAMHLGNREDLPQDKRAALKLSAYTLAHALDPESLTYALGLARALQTGQDSATQARELYGWANQHAVDDQGRLRNVGAMSLWARHLEELGLDHEAEETWLKTLAISPTYCYAATALQALYIARDYFPPPASFTPEHARCSELARRWRSAQREDDPDELLAQSAHDLARRPYNPYSHLAYIRTLRKAGQTTEAKTRLDTARALYPKARYLFEEELELAWLRGGDAQLMAAANQYIARFGNPEWLTWKIATITGSLPLEDLMRDGTEVAKQIASAPQTVAAAGDEAYYAIDFAAVKYFPDGSSVDITHTMVRVMTKNAIDRFAETSIPDGAKILRVRTVKPDGSTLEPSATSGKSTLSMPALAPGDFVEVAYITWNPAYTLSHTRRDGTRFFFKMADISSLHSEYVIVNPLGDVVMENAPPKKESFTYKGDKAIRFLQTNSPRPPREPAPVPADEYLPWVQLKNPGVTLDPLTLTKKYWQESILAAAKTSPVVTAQFERWLTPKAPPSEARAKDLFYKVNAFYERPSVGLSGDLSHGIVSKDGSPMHALLWLYRAAGFDADLYYAKKTYASPITHPMDAASQYTVPLLRVAWSDTSTPLWIESFGRSASFYAIDRTVIGEPALCLTCKQEEPVIQKVNPASPELKSSDVTITGTLDTRGTLKGSMTAVVRGLDAVNVRETLEKYKEQELRDKIGSYLLNQNIAGAEMLSFTIRGERDLGKPLGLAITFKAPAFARPDASGALVVDRPIFQHTTLTSLTTLASRTTPLFQGNPNHNTISLTLHAPKGMTISPRGQAGDLTLPSPFGDYAYTLKQPVPGTLTLTMSHDIPIRRITQDQYQDFKAWVRQVADTESLRLRIK